MRPRAPFPGLSLFLWALLGITLYGGDAAARDPGPTDIQVAEDGDPEGMAPPPPSPPPQQPPAQRNDDRLQMPSAPTNNESFIPGCWRTDPFRHRANQATPGVSSYCFDSNGIGRLEWRHDFTICRTRAQARFEGSMLRLSDSDTVCNDGTSWWADHLTCRRSADGVAACSGISYYPGGRAPDTWTVNLHALR